METKITFSSQDYRVFSSKGKFGIIKEFSPSELEQLNGMVISGDDCCQGKEDAVVTKRIFNPVLFVEAIDLIFQFIEMELGDEKNEVLQKIFGDFVSIDCYFFAKREESV
jgi:hypothetical protein